MKKTLALILTLAMMLGMVSFAGAEGTYNMPEMTTATMGSMQSTKPVSFRFR